MLGVLSINVRLSVDFSINILISILTDINSLAEDFEYLHTYR